MRATVDGIILREHTLGQDRLLTILTGEQGVLTAYANKAGAFRGKLAASTEVLCYSRFVLFTNRGRSVIDSADSNRIFFGLRQDLDKLCLASYFAQLAAELCPQGEEAAAALRLLLNTLHYLEKNLRDRRLLKAVFELRLLTLTGFMPDLVGCGGCAAFEHEDMFFSPLDATLLCGDCARERGQADRPRLSPGVLAAMRHILYAPPERLFSFTLGESSLKALADTSQRYLLSRVEKRFPALELLNDQRDNKADDLSV